MMFIEHVKQQHSLPDICCPEPGFELTIEECRALNYLLNLHHGLMKQSEEHYIHILRLINGIPQFLDKVK